MDYFQYQIKAIESGQHKYDGWTLDMNFRQGTRKKPDIDPHAPIPVGETVETDWAAWEELVADSEPAGSIRRIENFPNEVTFTE